MKPHLWLPVALAGSALLLAGCGKPASAATAGHDHSAHTGEEEPNEEGVTFKEGHGLLLPPEVAKALQVRTAGAELRPLAAELQVTAQVFATAPRGLASVRLPAGQAALLEKSSFTGAKLVRLDRTGAAATQLVELVFELDAATAPQPGDFVTFSLAGEPATVLAVPRSAILEGATGTFVYVADGDAYRRTAVQVGAHSAGFVEITGGLAAGATVVVTPVEQLWLAELRLTKGGGHSH